jgi:hypothetical protein
VPVPLGGAGHGALLPPGGLGLHGFSTGEPPPGVGLRMRGFFGRRPYVWSVLVPTLLAAIYFFAVAAPQYVSENRPPGPRPGRRGNPAIAYRLRRIVEDNS